MEIMEVKKFINDSADRKIREIVVKEKEQNQDYSLEQLAIKLNLKKTVVKEYLYWYQVEKALETYVPKRKAVYMFMFVKENNIEKMKMFYQINKGLNTRNFKILIDNYRQKKEILSLEEFETKNLDLNKKKFKLENEKDIKKYLKEQFAKKIKGEEINLFKLANNFNISTTTIYDDYHKALIEHIIGEKVSPIKSGILYTLFKKINDIKKIKEFYEKNKKLKCLEFRQICENINSEKDILENVENPFVLKLTKDEYDLIIHNRKYTKGNFKKLIDEFLTKSDEVVKITMEINEWLKNNENKRFDIILESETNMNFFNDLLEFSKKYSEE